MPRSWNTKPALPPLFLPILNYLYSLICKKRKKKSTLKIPLDIHVTLSLHLKMNNHMTLILRSSHPKKKKKLDLCQIWWWILFLFCLWILLCIKNGLENHHFQWLVTWLNQQYCFILARGKVQPNHKGVKTARCYLSCTLKPMLQNHNK